MIPKDLDYYPFDWQKVKDEQIQVLRDEIAKGRSERAELQLLKARAEARDIDQKREITVKETRQQEEMVQAKTQNVSRLVDELKEIMEANTKLIAAADAKIADADNRVVQEKAAIAGLEKSVKDARDAVEKLLEGKRAKQIELEHALEIKAVVDDAWRTQNISDSSPSDPDIEMFVARYHDMVATLKSLGSENEDLLREVHNQNARIKRLPSIFDVEQAKAINRRSDKDHQTPALFTKETLQRLTEEEQRQKEKLSYLDNSLRYILSKTADSCILPYRRKALEAANTPNATTEELLATLQERFEDLQVLMRETAFIKASQSSDKQGHDSKDSPREVQIIKAYETVAPDSTRTTRRAITLRTNSYLG